MPAGIRVILHVLQVIFLVLAVAGVAVLGLDWLVDPARITDADVADLRPAVITFGILSVAFSPILWSSRRHSVVTVPAPPAAQPLAPPPQFHTPQQPQPQHQPRQQQQPQQPQQHQHHQQQQPMAGYGAAPVVAPEPGAQPAPGGHSAQVSPAASPASPATGAPSEQTEVVSPPRWPPDPPR